jgi:glutamine synthetase
MAGLLEHAPAMAALTNPTVNSYKRLGARMTSSGATWSPTAATWAGNNRTALIRVPDERRFELRLADMSANPYLLAAAIGAAGLDGLNRAAVCPPPADLNMYNAATDPAVAAAAAAAKKLPPTLHEALNELEASEALAAGLGSPFMEAYLKLKRAHWAEYTAQLTPWELQTYLDA